MSTDSNGIFIVVEQEAGRPTSLTLELLAIGRRLADSGGELLCACVLGHGITEVADDIACYADEVYALDDPLLAGFQVDLYASALENLCRILKPGVLLLGHTYENFEVAPKIACRMGSELITDCVGLERDGAAGSLLCAKEVYGGNALAVFKLDTRPWIVTLRQKVYEAITRSESTGKVIPFDLKLDPATALTETVSTVAEAGVNLGSAEVIVSGGRGVKTPEGIHELERLVDVLKRRFDRVELGASRPLVNEGLVPRSRQIGQTGERVSPELYIAVAISGATQHVSGIIGSKKIIAINKDGDASIFRAADYGVVGSFEDVIPAFIEQMEKLS
jgi:electron transfer flavoprotein alpha subunit